MADEGFTIEDLRPLGIKLNIPPFVGSQGQMSPEDVVKTQTVTCESTCGKGHKQNERLSHLG